MTALATPTTPRTRRPTRSPEEEIAALWAMTPSERVAAMWRSELTLRQLSKWTSRAPHEVPLLGDEFAWIAMRTPEWAEPANDQPGTVIHLPERRSSEHAAA
jgi:hypothetical protein